MEGHSIIEPLAHQKNKTVHGNRSFFRIQMDSEFAPFCHFHKNFLFVLYINLHGRDGVKLQGLERHLFYLFSVDASIVV
jgi:hypothetical protein